MQCYLLWNKDHSSNLGTIWGQNHCFHIISQCIQAVKPHWYGVGPLLTLVYWSSSWSDILPNIDRFNFFDIATIHYDIGRTATLKKEVMLETDMHTHTYSHSNTLRHQRTRLCTRVSTTVHTCTHTQYKHTQALFVPVHALCICWLFFEGHCLIIHY